MPATTTALDAARISQIAQDIRTACQDFLSRNGDKREAAEVLTDSTKAESNAREATALALAQLSQAGQWSAEEAGAAAAKVPAMVNDLASQKAVSTYMGEVKCAMDPSVRSHVPALIALRDLMWTSEKMVADADKDATTPLRDAFQRQYHMLVAMFKATKSGRVLSTPEDVLEFAEEVSRAARLNVPKTLKKLKAMMGDILTIYADFPLDDLKVCADTLADLDEKALKGVLAPTKPAPTQVKTVARAMAPVSAPNVSQEDQGFAPTDLDDFLDNSEHNSALLAA